MTRHLDHPASTRVSFFGPWVVRATFVMALFGWGVGFYGPPIFLQTVVARTGWPLPLVSLAVTVHHLLGALVVTRLPGLHRRFGVGPVAVAGAVACAAGVMGWTVAAAPWQLLASALVSGAGWVTMGAVAVNAAIAPWYVRGRPMALAKAYNGASIGGVVFSPLWVLLIAHWGFTMAAASLGLLMVAVMLLLDRAVFTNTPERLGQQPDGEAPVATADGPHLPQATALAGRRLWCHPGFLTLAAGMATGLFAQIGLLAHLYALLVPAMGAQAAGWTMGFATACAMCGRLAMAKLLPAMGHRRHAAALAYGVQLLGTGALMLAGEQQFALILLGVALFGSGIGNATSLPPLIAQAEFAKDDVPRVVALIVAMAQATYAFAPAVFGLVLSAPANPALRIGSGTGPFFLTVAAVQVIAMLCFVAGRPRG